MAIPGSNPKMVLGSVVLWLPKKMAGAPDISRSVQGTQTEGHTHIQTVIASTRYSFKGKTCPFHKWTENWLTGAGTITDWVTAYLYFWDNVLKLGTPFTFYTSASFSTPDGLHVFERCVWTGKDYGLDRLGGAERYLLNVEFKTEGAAR